MSLSCALLSVLVLSEEFAILFDVVANPVGVYAVGVDVAAVNTDSVWRDIIVGQY
tara:strand:+ start:267 stop:431 length:165 start_codon:yes stop_codon:yes gene_type:complete